ncbi:hypothetical protein EV360DRAFT_70591 [Lentinula raphanica]|nr:hypothetical protein EV360DRAFT_70591 [Lentinula raphanica]
MSDSQPQPVSPPTSSSESITHAISQPHVQIPHSQQPATKRPSQSKYGKLALGFIFPFEEGILRAAQRDPEMEELTQEKPHPLLEIVARYSVFLELLREDVEDVWPNTFICSVEDPKTEVTTPGLMLSDNYTDGEVEQIQEVMDWREKVRWYYILIENSDRVQTRCETTDSKPDSEESQLHLESGSPRLTPRPSPVSPPASRPRPLSKYGKVALGFIFPFMEGVRQAAERDPEMKRLTEQKIFPLSRIISRYQIFLEMLREDVEDVWPYAFICGVEEPDTEVTTHGLMLSDNFTTVYSQIPTMAQVEQIQEIIEWREKKATVHSMTGDLNEKKECHVLCLRCHIPAATHRTFRNMTQPPLSNPEASPVLNPEQELPNTDSQAQPSLENSPPATTMLPEAQYGKFASGFIIPFDTAVQRAAEPDPGMEELLEETPWPILSIVAQMHIYLAMLCADIRHVWPNAFICAVREPHTHIAVHSVMLTDNCTPNHQSIPSMAQVKRIKEIIDLKERLRWYRVIYEYEPYTYKR